jgi:hypothetical protein
VISVPHFYVKVKEAVVEKNKYSAKIQETARKFKEMSINVPH